MGFFDFLADMEPYCEHKSSVDRLNSRFYHLIEPFKSDISGARVFDIASHDGRWAYAFAGAGAKEVVGVEARQELIDRFDNYPDKRLTSRVNLIKNDLFLELDRQVANGETYDVVSVFGILYHIMDHFRLLNAVRALKPKIVIVDSEFMDRPGQMVQIFREKTEKPLNAAPQFDGQQVAVVGYPSFKAMDVMADVLNYDLEWIDWTLYPENQRQSVKDYYRNTGIRRGSCVLVSRD